MPTLELSGIEKRYGRTRALAGLDLSIAAGEVLGVIGPNGAGKSTLVRMLAGEETPDAGTVAIDGTQWTPAGRSVAVVHQEPRLFPNLTVSQNLVVGREGYVLGRPRLSDPDRAVLAELGIEGHADVRLGACSLVVRQLTSIARALAQQAELFLFDEPNSALTEEESTRLFEQMHELAASGRFVILVSHRLGELTAHATRVAVIREGRCVNVLERQDISEDALARELVVGTHDAARTRRVERARAAGGASVLHVDEPARRGASSDELELDVAAGEIVALVGVEGSGARELLAGLGGYLAGRSRQTAPHSVYVPADRRTSLYPNHSVGQNLVARLPARAIAIGGYLLPRRIAARANELIETFRVRTESSFASIGSLSGGNQQKVAIAAAIAAGPRILLLEEPTRGVDISSKAEIYRLLREFADRGNGVLVLCTEVPEVFDLADRVVVIASGRVRGILDVGASPDVVSLASALTSLETSDAPRKPQGEPAA
jgi:ABC-type sugar transport system ATPase subunit